MKEIFVPVDSAPQFLISNRGRLYNTKTKRFRKATHKKGTYYYIFGNVNGRTHDVHRLVGTHYLPHTGGAVLHIDENLPYPDICCVDNLRVGSFSDNTRDAFDKGRASSNLAEHNRQIKAGTKQQWNKGRRNE
jgi:hypothetical protein